jgi:prolyl-tRNA synthetase
VPVRVEVGPRDLAEGTAVVVVRHDRSKTSVPLPALGAAVEAAIEQTAERLHTEALRFREEHTTPVDTLEEAVEAAGSGFAVVPWRALGDDGEDRLADAGVSVRCLRRADGSLAGVDDDDDLVAVVGKSY